MKTYEEDDLLPLSGLQHVFFCPRRAALVHLEGLWGDNLYTVEGRRLHERAHETGTEVRGDVRITRGLLLRSLELGLVGKADIVEFHRLSGAAEGVQLAGAQGLWRPLPVEYKRGRKRHEKSFEVQLCAQALCLEEMLDVPVPAGAIYYGKSGRRMEVSFDDALRTETRKAAGLLHRIIAARKTPPAHYEKKCESCSLLEVCMPRATGTGRSALRYLREIVEISGGDV